MKKKIIENIPLIIFTGLFIIGLAIMFYPTISSYQNQQKYNQMITNYDELAQQDSKDKILQEAKKYNQKLTKNSIEDAFLDPKEENSNQYLSLLNIGYDGEMGYLEIPKIGIKLPIYHGTSAETLQKGVGHLEGSSLPIGGKSTHSILSAHRGLPTATLFTDLDQLQEGDMFYVKILNKTLAYQVDQILVTEPTNTKALMIEEGKDFITLVTCTPYAVNTHRLLVRGTHVPYKEQNIDQMIKNEKKANYFSRTDLYLSIGIWMIDIILVIAILITNKSYRTKMNR